MTGKPRSFALLRTTLGFVILRAFSRPKDPGGVPGMGVIYKVKVLNGEGSSSRSSRQGRPW